jgi:hypothetical protein
MGGYVIGLGMKRSTSPLLANSCDEFIYYEDLEARPRAGRGGRQAGGRQGSGVPAAGGHRARAAARELRSDPGLAGEGHHEAQAPAFSEVALGYRSFSEMLEDAEDDGIIELRRDDRSGTYMVTAVASERSAPERSAPPRSAPPRPAHHDPRRATRARATRARAKRVRATCARAARGRAICVRATRARASAPIAAMNAR